MGWDIVTASEAYQSENPVSDSYKEVTSGDQLNQWDGYWFKTNQADLTVKIPAPPDLPDSPPSPDYLKPRMTPVAEFAKIRAEYPKSGDFGYGQFNLQLSLTSKFASDLTTTLGTRQNAELGWDVMDSAEPPILGETVAAYFKHNDWKERAGMYNRDIQPALQIGKSRTWQLTVYTGKPETELTLTWKDAIEDIPGDIMLSFRIEDCRFKIEDCGEHRVRLLQSSIVNPLTENDAK